MPILSLLLGLFGRPATNAVSWSIGLAVALALGLAVLAWRWLDPPEATYTQSEIAAAAYKRDNDTLRHALSEQTKTLSMRDSVIKQLTEDNARLASAPEPTPHADSATPIPTPAAAAPAAPAIGPDDPWLRAWRKAGR
jgi:hypothetical protein